MATTQINFTVFSPGDAGYATGNLVWGNASDDATIHFTVHDIAADGHGPYVHYIDDTGYKFGEYHLTSGANTDSQALVGYDIGHTIQYVDFWVCNGGTSTGNAADGCYGRRAYNQYTYPGKASLSLGNTTGLIY